MIGQDHSLHILIVPTEWVYATSLDPRTYERCKEATRLWKQGGVDMIVPTGGRFVRGQTRSAAAMMADALELHGVPRDAILMEDQALDSYENADFVLHLLWRSFPGKRFHYTVVTDIACAPRMSAVFRCGFGLQVESAWAEYPLTALDVAREFIGYHWVKRVDPLGRGRVARFIRRRRLYAAARG